MSESSATASRPPTPVTGDTAIPSTAKPYRFNWEASRRPGPESVSGTTSDGRGHDDYFNAIPQLGNLHLNSSTTSLALGSVPTEWSSSRHGFNGESNLVFRSVTDTPQLFPLSSTIHTSDRHRPRRIPRCRPYPPPNFRACGGRTLTPTSNPSLQNGTGLNTLTNPRQGHLH